MSSESDTASITKNSLSIQLSQSAFQNALSLVSKAVAKHGIQPVLSNILLVCNAEEGSVTVAATDLNLSLACKLKCTVLQAGEITVPSQKLLELVSKLQSEDLNFTSDDNCGIKITSGRSKFEIKGLSSEQFPQEFLQKAKEVSDSVKIPREILTSAVNLVAYACDKRESSSILNGVCLQIAESGLELAATDGSRLACFSDASVNTNSSNLAEALRLVLPYRALLELNRMLVTDEDEFVECIFGKRGEIIFKTSTKTYCSSLLEGTYPKYRQLVPQSSSQLAVVDRVSLISCLERVSVLANERTRVVKLFFESSNKLSVSASTPDLGEAQDQIDLISYNGNDLTIAFNVNYMIECLRSLTVTNIQIQTNGVLDPIIVSQHCLDDAENEKSMLKPGQDYFYLLMPVQLRSGT
jgi:DNA polymerase III subunit beta